jgi:hypothetical protein
MVRQKTYFQKYQVWQAMDVIHNIPLSNLLQLLADSMSGSIKTANQMASKLVTRHLYS